MAVGGVGYTAGRLIHGDLPYLKEYIPYQYKNAKAAGRVLWHDVTQALEPGMRVTKISYGVFRDTVDVNLTIPPDDMVAYGMADTDRVKDVPPGTEVILYDRHDNLFPKAGVISRVEDKDDKATVYVVLPDGFPADKNKGWRAEVAVTEADTVKRLPVSALVSTPEGDNFVWLVWREGDHYILTRQSVSVGLRSQDIFEPDSSITADHWIVMNPGKNLKDGQIVTRIARRGFDVDTMNTHEILAKATFDIEIMAVRTALFQIKANKERATGKICSAEIDPLLTLTSNPPPRPRVTADPNAYPKPKGCGTCGGQTPPSAAGIATGQKPVLLKPPMPF